MIIYEKDGFVGELIENGWGKEVLTLLEYKGRRKKVNVPASIDGVKVEFLCRTFMGNETVEEVRIPRGVTTLGDEVFEGCTSLKKVSLSKTVREIGREVFHHCTHLEEVEIPVPSEVEIHHLAFDEGRYPWDQEGFLIFGQILFRYSGQNGVVRIPEGVREVRQTAFSYGTALTSMEELYFPTTVTEIKSDMLADCHQLKKLVFAEGLKKIPIRGVACPSLEEVQLPSTLEELGEHSVSPCDKLMRIQFAEPSALKVIKPYTFQCASLREITLPSSVERVERLAFEGCNQLSDVTLSPDTQVEKGAFDYPWEEWAFIHPKVVASYKDKEQSDYYRRHFDRWEQLKPDQQEEIKEGIGRYLGELDCCVDYLSGKEEEEGFLPSLFQEKTEKEMDLFFHWGLSLTLTQFETYLNHSVQTGNPRITAYLLQKKKEIYTKIEIEAYGIRKEMLELGLEQPSLEELSRKWYLEREEDGVVVSGYRGGSGREVLPSHSAEGVKLYQVGVWRSFGLQAHPFSGLTYLEMGKGMVLHPGAWENSDIEEILLPTDLKKIPDDCFANAPLSHVVIPEGVRWIGDRAFYKTKLEEVVLPSSLTKLRDTAFDQCPLLKKVVLRGSMEVLEPMFHLDRLGVEAFFKNCPSLEFVGQEGGDNQLERLRAEGIIDKP